MAFEITPTIEFPGLLHLTFKTQYELSSTMLRLQEFYESPFDQFRGKIFRLETYMDLYASEYDGRFTYFEDFNGYNVPGHIVDSFFDTYLPNELLEKEKDLRDVIYESVDGEWEKFYVIGSYEDDGTDGTTQQHEMAHGFYYLLDEYRERADKILDEFSMGADIASNIFTGLRKQGYMIDVFKDETQAYFATSDMMHLHDFFQERELPWKQVLECKLMFQEYYDKHITEYEYEYV